MGGAPTSGSGSTAGRDRPDSREAARGGLPNNPRMRGSGHRGHRVDRLLELVQPGSAVDERLDLNVREPAEGHLDDQLVELGLVSHLDDPEAAAGGKRPERLELVLVALVPGDRGVEDRGELIRGDLELRSPDYESSHVVSSPSGRL